MESNLSSNNVVKWFRESITIKLIVIGILLLLMLIPVGMINDLIRERKDTYTEARWAVVKEWGLTQTIRGPILRVPAIRKTSTTNSKGEVQIQKETISYYFLPESLNFDAQMHPETLHRGLYDQLVYRSDVKMSGRFGRIHHDDWNSEDLIPRIDKAELFVGISDLNGVNERITMDVPNRDLEFSPAQLPAAGLSSGVKSNKFEARDNFQFLTTISLNGSDGLEFAPLAEETTVTVSSPWDSPSFYGEFLPRERKIAKNEGFEGEWKVLHLNRPIVQQWKGTVKNLKEYDFGVKLFEGVGEYHKIARSAKYAVLFIALTFMTFFFIQLINKVSIHGLQFLMVGFALCVFYTLLLSLSEHVGFDTAYLIGAIAIILQISLYVKSVFKSMKLGGIVMGILIALYTFIFVIIQLENFALLVGSIGLFIALAIMMYITRNIDWSSFGTKQSIELKTSEA